MGKIMNYFINLLRYFKINIYFQILCINYVKYFKEKENNEYFRYYLEFDKMREKKGIVF